MTTNGKEAVHTQDADRLKWISVWILLIAGIGANYYFGYVAISLRLIGWLVLAGVVSFVIFQTQKGQQIWEFAQQSRVELRKVVWPEREETLKVTLVVVAMVVVVALILWAIDSGLLWMMGLLTGQR